MGMMFFSTCSGSFADGLLWLLGCLDLIADFVEQRLIVDPVIIRSKRSAMVRQSGFSTQDESLRQIRLPPFSMFKV